MRAYAVRSSTPLPARSPRVKDARAELMMKEAGREAARGAAVVLLSGYCSDVPGLIATEPVRSLRTALFGTLDPSRWTARLDAALITEPAVELAARLERHRAARHMSEARFVEVLLGAI